jgi:predicted peptidase
LYLTTPNINKNGKILNNKRLFAWMVFIFSLGHFLPVSGQKVEGYQSTLTGDEIRYAVYLPDGYSLKKKYPLLIFLHGMDEKTWPAGGFNPKIKATGLPLLLEEGLKLPFVVLAPCCAYADWDNIGYTKDQKTKLHAPGALTREVAGMAIKKYSIDTTRLYLTGLSMGGAGVFSAVQYFPDLFHAAIPIAGWGDPNKACHIKTAVWAFQGADDGGAGVKNVIDAIKKCSPQSESKASILQGQGHHIWDMVYSNKASGNVNIYDWLLKYSAGK